MEELSTRDRAWDAIIEIVCSRQSAVVQGVPHVLRRAELDESKSRTVRRVLRSMTELGYLKKGSDRGHTWYPGEKAEELWGVKW